MKKTTRRNTDKRRCFCWILSVFFPQIKTFSGAISVRSSLFGHACRWFCSESCRVCGDLIFCVPYFFVFFPSGFSCYGDSKAGWSSRGKLASERASERMHVCKAHRVWWRTNARVSSLCLRVDRACQRGKQGSLNFGLAARSRRDFLNLRARLKRFPVSIVHLNEHIGNIRVSAHSDF